MDSINISLKELLFRDKKEYITFNKLIPAENVLVLAPHSDDEVLGCAGTIIRYLEVNTNVTILYLTDGRYGIENKNYFIRRDEAINAWKNRKGIKQIFCDFQDSNLKDNEREVIEVIQKTIRDISPDVIFTPWFCDRHSDHEYTAHYLSKALFLNEFNCVISFYEVAYPLFANHTINITKQWKQKMMCLDAFESQMWMNVKRFITSLNQYRAQLTRFKTIKYAESFFVTDSDLLYQILKSWSFGIMYN